MTFADMLTRFPGTMPWNVATNFDGFFHAAVEASDLDEGATRLAEPQPLSFDDSLTVQYVGDGSFEDGAVLYGFLFRGYEFDALIGIEDDLNRAKLVWRGNKDAFSRAEVLLRMFEGRTLAHLR